MMVSKKQLMKNEQLQGLEKYKDEESLETWLDNK